MPGSKPGERRGGRQRGAKNKATLEREQRALVELQRKADSIPLIKPAKDMLAALVPRAEEFAGAVAGVVRMKQEAALVKNASKRVWDELREWMALYDRVLATAATVGDKAASFQAPKFKAIMVAVSPSEAAKESRRMIEIDAGTDPEARAGQSYLRLVKG